MTEVDVHCQTTPGGLGSSDNNKDNANCTIVIAYNTVMYFAVSLVSNNELEITWTDL